MKSNVISLATLSSLSVLTTSFFANTAVADEDTAPAFKPAVALLVDYVATENGMWGVTLAPKHFDPDYSNWGYYIGYAWGDKYQLDVEEPAEANMEEYMWRLGVSYSLSQNLSIYGGATAYTYETNYTNNISPRDVNGKPRWESDRDREWGAEVGLHYNLYKGFVLGAGYDTRNKAAVISIGLTM